MIKRLRYRKWERIIRKSNLFDIGHYLLTYPDVRKKDVDPVRHYVRFGANEGRNPCSKFDTKFYLSTNVDVKQAGINPLVHYIKYGTSEGRKTSAKDNPAKSSTSSIKRVNPPHVLIKDVKKPGLIKKTYLHFKTEGAYLTLKRIKSYLLGEYYNPALVNKTYGSKSKSHGSKYKGITGVVFHPKISIIVPNYNHAQYLNKRIDSILNQTYQNFELLLLDDCSNDDSRKILKSYASKNPKKIKLFFNEQNTGNVFKQWRKGVENSAGELIWICESDDYCENDFLEKLIAQFKNPGVNIAFGKIQFCDKNDKMMEGLDRYREGAEPGIWNKVLVRPANYWFCNAFGINNVIANVGGCVFKKQNIKNEIWEEAQTYKILGDWFLYLHLANGGLIAYEPSATAYFRQHGANTSVSSFSTAKYYEEHHSLMTTMKETWYIPNDTVDKFYSKLKAQYKHFKCEEHLGGLEKYVNINDIKAVQKNKKHILIGSLAFHPGGGELFPIILANALQEEGNIVSLFVLNMQDINQDMYNSVSKQIAIYDSKFVTMYGVDAFLKHAGVSIINTHMASLDAFFLVKNKVRLPYFATLHGSYEACLVPQNLIRTISEGVTRWIYTADRNLTALEFLNEPINKFIKLPNAMPIDNEPFPKTREELGIGEKTIVFTLVARGIKRKGWRVSINAFLELEKQYPDVHLIICGDGEEASKYKNAYSHEPKITFLGFQSKIHGLYKISDCALVPTRFEGESYPLCIIQALQVGIPVISSDVGEIKLMLTADDNAFAGIILPNERNTENFTNLLSDAMQQMLSSEQREKFSLVSRKLANKYSISALAKQYINVFDKKILYIHIGWPKTGTSAIQQFFVNNYKVLQNKYDLLYPDFGRWKDGSHHNIAFALRKNPYCNVKTKHEQHDYLNQLKKELLISKCGHILLSSECFDLYDNEIFKKLFAKRFDIKIICYLRDQDQYVESIYGQNVRDPFFKEKRTFKEFANDFKDKLFYSKSLRRWQELTHKDNFIIRYYDPNKFINGNIIDDFMTQLNINLNAEDYNHTDSIVNESYTKTVLEYKRQLNIIMSNQNACLVQMLQIYSKQNPEPKTSFFSNEEKNTFNSYFELDNKAISNEYLFCNFTKTKYYENEENIVNKLNDCSNKTKFEQITDFIFKNDINLFQSIKNECITYQGEIDKDRQIILNSFLER